MTRQFPDWIPAYLEYTAGTEAPRRMHFWAGVACIASCLRRKVWIDMKRFKWTPNFFIIFVAPPGIISKTTTMDMGMDLVKQVPGIKFGPDVVTWQALVTTFAAAQEEFQCGDAWYPMSALTLASGELGNLLNPQDRELVNLFIALWDGRSGFEKVTKGSGNDSINAPWINMIGCTTPHWIADNMPASTIGGGFVSRCVFVYADRKEAFIAYPDEFVKPDHEDFGARLRADLEHISLNLVGPAAISEDARRWGRQWYERLWTTHNASGNEEHVNAYIARKQTHMHKLALVLSVSRSDSLVIELEDLVLADKMLQETEGELEKVFSRIGRTEDSLNVERFIDFVRTNSPVPFVTAYRHVHREFPDFRVFQSFVQGAVSSGQVAIRYGENSTELTKAFLVYTGAQK
jgi:hypothetical protein